MAGRKRRWRENLAAGNDVDLELWVGGGDVCRRESEFTTHDIATLRQGTRLVKGDLAIAALASEAAVVRDNQLFRRNIFQRLADFGGPFAHALRAPRTH
jgi:hypothetical protein